MPRSRKVVVMMLAHGSVGVTQPRVWEEWCSHVPEGMSEFTTTATVSVIAPKEVAHGQEFVDRHRLRLSGHTAWCSGSLVHETLLGLVALWKRHGDGVDMMYLVSGDSVPIASASDLVHGGGASWEAISPSGAQWFALSGASLSKVAMWVDANFETRLRDIMARAVLNSDYGDGWMCPEHVVIPEVFLEALGHVGSGLIVMDSAMHPKSMPATVTFKDLKSEHDIVYDIKDGIATVVKCSLVALMCGALVNNLERRERSEPLIGFVRKVGPGVDFKHVLRDRFWQRLSIGSDRQKIPECDGTDRYRFSGRVDTEDSTSRNSFYHLDRSQKRVLSWRGDPTDRLSRHGFDLDSASRDTEHRLSKHGSDLDSAARDTEHRVSARLLGKRVSYADTTLPSKRRRHGRRGPPLYRGVGIDPNASRQFHLRERDA